MLEDIVSEVKKIKVQVLVVAAELDKLEPIKRLRSEVSSLPCSCSIVSFAYHLSFQAARILSFSDATCLGCLSWIRFSLSLAKSFLYSPTVLFWAAFRPLLSYS